MGPLYVRICEFCISNIEWQNQRKFSDDFFCRSVLYKAFVYGPVANTYPLFESG